MQAEQNKDPTERQMTKIARAAAKFTVQMMKADGIGPASKAIMGQPELIFLGPVGFLQGIRGQHQNPALVVQRFIRVALAVLRAK